MRTSDTAQIFFEGVRVPKRNRIGDEGKGFVYQMMQFQEERACGPLRLASKRTSTRLPRRSPMRASAEPSAAPSSTIRPSTSKLAELQTEIELLRSLVYRAAEAMIEAPM